jgi:phosphoribosylamine--glycine ligase/phosphoribosylformylglycinamidine cyclo-ligase
MSTSNSLRVLIIGSGGREHAIAWKIARSPHLQALYAIPGNPGIAGLGTCVPLKVEDHRAIVEFCQTQQIDLVIIGPEAPLAAGLTDDLLAAGIKVFGPTKAAAQIEASKAFAKAFMTRHGIPTARYEVFTDYEAAIRFLERVEYPVVLKASGLAAGKGVIVPETTVEALAALEEMMRRKAFGAAGETVVIEERLSGPEVSLMAFCDGRTLVPMLPAQDHKRLLDGDRGPNTGGMGAYAPAPICPPAQVAEIVETILQPALSGLREEGRPFVGVLYAGLMLTEHGPHVLEFNCRFGDPETQAVLPLLESDLLEIALACAEGRLDEVQVRWREGAAVCVVLASAGYPFHPESGKTIHGLDNGGENIAYFHAGTEQVDGQLVTAGGRVLGVTAWAESLERAVAEAYQAVNRVRFEGMQYRKDIARAALAAGSKYAASGVSIDAGNQAVELMKEAVRSTYGPQVLAGIGAFGGLFDAAALKQMKNPVLVASTDGVGTKVKLAAASGRYRSIGQDIVNHCINDILVQGARPLFFLDYFATAKLSPAVVAEVVSGMAEACRAAGVALLGGETAEMPGVYAEGEFDVAGTIVGVVERDAILPRPDIRRGDVLIGLRSSGPHTNGYSLIRKIFADVSLDKIFPELGVPLAEALLAPHRSYLDLLLPLLNSPMSPVKALVHITGGGFFENIPRVLPSGMGAVIRRGSWPVPPLFELIQRHGEVDLLEMYRVFNMGIGMVVIAAPENAGVVQEAIGEETWIIGEVSGRESKVILA